MLTDHLTAIHALYAKALAEAEAQLTPEQPSLLFTEADPQ